VPVLIDENDGIIAGHGRIMAAGELGLDGVPVVVARGWSGAQKRAYVLADNKLTENGGWDNIGALESLGFDISLTGFTLGDLEPLLGQGKSPAGIEDAPNLEISRAVRRDRHLLGRGAPAPRVRRIEWLGARGSGNRTRACTATRPSGYVCLAPNSGAKADIPGPPLWAIKTRHRSEYRNVQEFAVKGVHEAEPSPNSLPSHFKDNFAGETFFAPVEVHFATLPLNQPLRHGCAEALPLFLCRGGRQSRSTAG
jgi:hypothetical protein